MKNKCIKVLGIQLQVELDCNETNEYLIETSDYYLNNSKNIEVGNL